MLSSVYQVLSRRHCSAYS